MAENDIGGALDRTLSLLGGGVLRVGIAAALPEISGWERRLAASGDPDLAAVAGTLSELRAQLDPDGLDLVTVGSLLMSVGDQVEQVAGAEIGKQVAEKLARLGRLLGEEGDSLTDRLTKIG